MFIESLRQLKRGPRECRQFAWVIGGALLLLGAWLTWQEGRGGPWFLAASAVVLGLGIAVPTTLRMPYLLWMTVGLALGTVMSVILLVCFFYLVLTPVGWLARLAGKDFLELKQPRQATSYWHPREEVAKPESYTRQF